MGKSVICVMASVLFVVINTIILFLKPSFSYAENDENNFQVYYQKWIATAIFMGTIIVSLLCVYFAISLSHIISFSLLAIECVLVVMYALVRYKCVTISSDDIKIERLFMKEINTNFNAISKVTYVPNAKLVIKLKRRGSFDVSFNSQNFYKLYKILLTKDLKYKTGRIPNDENHVYLTKYNITIHFPKTMFREFYQSDTYLYNSKYLFSARSLENKEYIEGYTKDSSVNLADFINIIQKDLEHHQFKFIKSQKQNINGYSFTIISANSKKNKDYMRLAYIYPDHDNYFVMYADILAEKEKEFMAKMQNAIQRSVYEDGKSKIVRV